MTEVAFHTGVVDPLDYACRLLRKASRQGARVLVIGEPQQLSRLDVLLWTFDPGEFIAHARLRAGQAAAAEMALTPIWLVDDLTQAPPASVLVNLGAEGPEHIGAFERVVEIVSTDDQARLTARQRWRRYEATGHAVVHHAKA